MILRFTILLGILFGYTFGITQSKGYDPETKFSVEQLQEDFRILHSAIGLGHPAWGQYHSVDSLEHWFRTTGAQIKKPMTETEFLQLLYPAIQSLGCGHTRLMYSKDFVKLQKKKDNGGYKRKYLPFKSYWVNQKMYITSTNSPDSLSIPVGAEVLKINDLKVTKIYQSLSQLVTNDGYNQTHQEQILNSNFEGYYRLYYGGADNYRVQLIEPTGDTTTLSLKANTATLKERLKQSSQKTKKKLAKGEKIHSRKGYHLRLMENAPNTAIIDIRGFKQRQGKRFYKKAFKYIEKNDVENLVLDLRNNGGGAVKDAAKLISYLAQEEHELKAFKKWKKHPYEKYFKQKYIYKIIAPIALPFYFKSKKEGDFVALYSTVKPKNKNHFDGNLYVLNNGRTFSASVLVGAYLWEEKRALFIGQETGGGLTGTNAFLMPKFELPNSKIRLHFPLYEIQHQITTDQKGRGLMPDIYLDYSLEDILMEKDLELEQVKKLIEKK